ncbi:sensor histidine kinase [Tellurirhabdus bombi]|uniref:sensor histidine kinase n=1 Tax=Tellurirhabdus bombi TaxID=2907205 RepID=UPI001F326A8A|nr:ATP-binding protein [Tellurirhabdus bombi]
MTIRTRLTFVFATMVASIMLLFSLSIYYLYSQHRETEFKQRLREEAFTTVRLLQSVGHDSGGVLRRIDVGDPIALYKDQVVVYNSNNTVIYNSSGQAIRFMSTLVTQIHNGREVYVRENDDELIGVPYQSKKGEKLAVIVTANDRYGFSKLNRLRQILTVGWIISLGILILAGWLFAGDALKPVSDIINQVNDISATNINARLRVGRQHDELAKLAATFNAMLGRLDEAFTAQKSFVSHASHELRTPLAVMMGEVEVSLMQTRSPEEYQKVLEGVLEEIQKLRKLVNGLLELTSASADAATLSFEPVRVDELLWQVRSTILQQNPSYSIDIRFENMPEQEEELMILGVDPLLRTAFQNLMENGCKYSHNQQCVVSVHINSIIQVSFSDKGDGISTDELPHIYEPFFRSNASVAGNGLGLALARRIILQHRGSIDVQSTLGEGSTFTVSFPKTYALSTESKSAGE